MVGSGAAIHVCPNWYGFSPLSLSTKQLSLKSAGGDVLYHLGSKTESDVYRNLKFQVIYEVAPVVRPILAVDMLTRKGVLVVFGVQGDSSFIQLSDGHKIPMIRENGTMVLNSTLVDRRNMKCDLVARLFRLQFQCQVKRVMRKCVIQETCQSVKRHKFQCWEEHEKRADQNNRLNPRDEDMSSVTCRTFRCARSVAELAQLMTHIML